MGLLEPCFKNCFQPTLSPCLGQESDFISFSKGIDVGNRFYLLARHMEFAGTFAGGGVRTNADMAVFQSDGTINTERNDLYPIVGQDDHKNPDVLIDPRDGKRLVFQCEHADSANLRFWTGDTMAGLALSDTIVVAAPFPTYTWAWMDGGDLDRVGCLFRKGGSNPGNWRIAHTPDYTIPGGFSTVELFDGTYVDMARRPDGKALAFIGRGVTSPYSGGADIRDTLVWPRTVCIAELLLTDDKIYNAGIEEIADWKAPSHVFNICSKNKLGQSEDPAGWPGATRVTDFISSLTDRFGRKSTGNGKGVVSFRASGGLGTHFTQQIGTLNVTAGNKETYSGWLSPNEFTIVRFDFTIGAFTSGTNRAFAKFDLETATELGDALDSDHIESLTITEFIDAGDGTKHYYFEITADAAENTVVNGNGGNVQIFNVSGTASFNDNGKGFYIASLQLENGGVATGYVCNIGAANLPNNPASILYTAPHGKAVQNMDVQYTSSNIVEVVIVEVDGFEGVDEASLGNQANSKYIHLEHNLTTKVTVQREMDITGDQPFVDAAIMGPSQVVYGQHNIQDSGIDHVRFWNDGNNYFIDSEGGANILTRPVPIIEVTYIASVYNLALANRFTICNLPYTSSTVWGASTNFLWTINGLN